MYICENCGRLYDGDFGTHIEHHGHSSYYDEEVDNDLVCGTCGGEYVEATKCAICGEWCCDNEEVGICDNCLDKAKNCNNALAIWEDDTVTVEVNPALAYVLGKDKINKILTTYLMAHKDEYATDIRLYINENIDVLADILKERKEKINGRNTD